MSKAFSLNPVVFKRNLLSSFSVISVLSLVAQWNACRERETARFVAHGVKGRRRKCCEKREAVIWPFLTATNQEREGRGKNDEKNKRRGGR